MSVRVSLGPLGTPGVFAIRAATGRRLLPLILRRQENLVTQPAAQPAAISYCVVPGDILCWTVADAPVLFAWNGNMLEVLPPEIVSITLAVVQENAVLSIGDGILGDEKAPDR